MATLAFEASARDAFALFDTHDTGVITADDDLAALSAVHIDAARQQLQNALGGKGAGGNARLSPGGQSQANFGGAASPGGPQSAAVSQANLLSMIGRSHRGSHASMANFDLSYANFDNDASPSPSNAGGGAGAKRFVSIEQFMAIAGAFAIRRGSSQDTFLAFTQLDKGQTARVSAEDLAAAADEQWAVERVMGGGEAATAAVFKPLLHRGAAYGERGMSLPEWRAMAAAAIGKPPKKKKIVAPA